MVKSQKVSQGMAVKLTKRKGWQQSSNCFRQSRSARPNKNHINPQESTKNNDSLRLYTAICSKTKFFSKQQGVLFGSFRTFRIQPEIASSGYFPRIAGCCHCPAHWIPGDSHASSRWDNKDPHRFHLRFNHENWGLMDPSCSAHPGQHKNQRLWTKVQQKNMGSFGEKELPAPVGESQYWNLSGYNTDTLGWLQHLIDLRCWRVGDLKTWRIGEGLILRHTKICGNLAPLGQQICNQCPAWQLSAPSPSL